MSTLHGKYRGRADPKVASGCLKDPPPFPLYKKRYINEPLMPMQYQTICLP